MFPRAFFPGPVEVVKAFFSLTYKGILPDYLQDSLLRLITGAAVGMALGHFSARGCLRIGTQQMGAPRVVADPAVLPGHRRHRLAAVSC